VILVTEDETLIAMLASDILTDAGYEVVEVYNADEALAVLNERHDVGVLFTDVNMPGSFDGYALARIVDMRWPGIGIVVTTARDAPGRGELPRKAGFLAKPYSPAGLLATVQAASDPAAQPIRVHRVAPIEVAHWPATPSEPEAPELSPLHVLPTGPRPTPDFGIGPVGGLAQPLSDADE
jgi:CheY-like chemotaxis protein